MAENRATGNLRILCEAAECFRKPEITTSKDKNRSDESKSAFNQRQLSALKNFLARAKSTEMASNLNSEDTVEVLQAAHQCIQILRQSKKERESVLDTVNTDNAKKWEEIVKLRSELSPKSNLTNPGNKLVQSTKEETSQSASTFRTRTFTEPSAPLQRRPPLVKSRKRNNDDWLRNRTLSISFDPINLGQQVRRHHEQMKRPSNDHKKIKMNQKVGSSEISDESKKCAIPEKVIPTYCAI